MPPAGGAPSPGSGACSLGTRPGSGGRAAGARRRFPRPLNLPDDSDAGVARKAAGKSGVRAPGAREQRSPPCLGTELPVPGAVRAIGRAPGPGVPPTWPRCHGVGSDSRRGPYPDGGHAGNWQLWGLREPGRDGDKGGDRAAPGTVSSERRRLPVTTTTAAQSKPALQAWPDEPRDAGHAGDSGRLGGSAPVRGQALAHSGARVHPR